MRHVALLIETSGAYGRGLLRGIARYNRERGGWSTYFRPHGLGGEPPSWLRHWKGDGMLVRIDSRQMADIARRSGAPVVNLRNTVPDLPFPYVTVDNEQIGRLGAQHLLERGIRTFGFYGRAPGVNPALDDRATGFVQAIRAAGADVAMFHSAQPGSNAGWEQEQTRLADWIRSLGKPVGIMACNDELGLNVLDACRRCGAAVPDEVAVIGVDNDLPLCDLSIPPMSSVDTNAEMVGYTAASLLDQMMGGKEPTERVVRVAPRGVVTRRSTDVIASEDPEVNRALRFIRERAFGNLQVSDVLQHMNMSRATLQHRLKQVTGRTIHQEIQRVRLNRCQELLARSDLTIKQVARASGFASVQYMTRVFSAVVGETPARYRAKRAMS